MAKNNAWQPAQKVINSAQPSLTGKVGPSSFAHVGEAQELMDVRALAELLRLDRQTIYNWLHQHKLAGIKVGGVWRFDRRAIQAWLAEQTVETQALRQRRPRKDRVPSEVG